MSIDLAHEMGSTVGGHNAGYFLVMKEVMIESTSSINHMVFGAWYVSEILTETVQNCEDLSIVIGDGKCDEIYVIDFKWSSAYNDQ